jgi:NosR/NirI family nitrous oxide reductase transcriptional regulator
MSLLRRVLLVLGLGALLASGVHGVLTREKPFTPDAELLRRVAQDPTPSVRQEGPSGPYYTDEAGAGGARPKAIAFLTDQVEPRVRGYADEISLLVGIDDSAVVTGVRLIDHAETPSYMKKIVEAGFLERMAGRRLGADLAGVDAVTGATITSEAIRRDVLQSGGALSAERLGIEIEGAGARPGFARALLDPHSIAVLLAMGLAVVAFVARSFRAGRAISLAAGFLVLGLYCNLPLSTAHFTDLASLKLPPPSNAPLIILLCFVFATGLIFRSRVYCDYVCPFAAVQEAIYAVSKRRPAVSDRLWRGAAFVRHLILFVIAIAVALGGYRAAAAMEPYLFLFNPGAAVLPWIYVGVAVGAAFFVRRFWCRLFCPCGACVEIASSLRRRRGPASDRRPADEWRTEALD